jgi:hypothetical protein
MQEQAVQPEDHWGKHAQEGKERECTTTEQTDVGLSRTEGAAGTGTDMHQRRIAKRSAKRLQPQAHANRSRSLG